MLVRKVDGRAHHGADSKHRSDTAALGCLLLLTSYSCMRCQCYAVRNALLDAPSRMQAVVVTLKTAKALLQ
jgi:hypothetical protein